MNQEKVSSINNNNDSKDKPSISKIPWVRSDLVRHKKGQYYYETSDLVIIALFCALGGILSTFVGYLGNLINRILGIPFGGGQILAGLHIFWIIFIYLLTNRKIGVAFFTGIVKGFIEFFSGSAHGILVLLISGTQGLIIEIILILFLSSNNKMIISFASGLASTSNVFIQQLIFFNSQIPPLFIAFIGGLSFISGFILGGIFPIAIYHLFSKSTILNWRKTPSSPHHLKYIQLLRISIIFFLVVSEIAIFSFLLFQNRFSVQITGDIYNPYTFYPADFLDRQVTIEAELIGDVSYEPPKNYTGVPLYIIIEAAQPVSEIFLVKVIASDGYFIVLSSTEIQENPSLILTMEPTGLRLIAKNLHGSYWVKKVNRIAIEGN
ncbi:MAG: ECF transporter S component [Candidatus Heimdallarchaeota archaeon]|nr:MAG: ECF transporter S component [Candidatus Heimdallarchaeota archaeon]